MPAVNIFFALAADMDGLCALGVARILTAHQPGADSAACRRQAERLCALIATCSSAGQLARCLLDQADPSFGEPGGVDLLSMSLRVLAACFATSRAAHSTRSSAPVLASRLAPALSYRALERARTTIDDFSTFYLPLHGLPRAAFFAHLPLLVFTEAAIYQLDEENEDFVSPLAAGTAAAAAPPSLGSGVGATLLGVLADEGKREAGVTSAVASPSFYVC